LVSTSANAPGAPPLRSIDAIQKIMGQGVDLFLDAGELPERKPSTVVDVTQTAPRLLRAGAIETSRIRAVVRDLRV